MRDENCIFCKIAAGEIPSATLYEDDDFRVILDIEPASKGHALILPKEHYANLYELDDEIAAKVLVLAKKIVTKLSDILGSVFHYHMHLIPRYKDDTVDIKWKLGTLTEEDKEYILKKMNEK